MMQPLKALDFSRFRNKRREIGSQVVRIAAGATLFSHHTGVLEPIHSSSPLFWWDCRAKNSSLSGDSLESSPVVGIQDLKHDNHSSQESLICNRFMLSKAFLNQISWPERVSSDAQSSANCFEMSAGPDEIRLYDSDHALNADARRDRIDFLRKHLLLSNLSSRILDTILQTK
jgi:hypothetical protein